MAVALSGLPCVTPFDTVGEPETKMDFVES